MPVLCSSHLTARSEEDRVSEGSAQCLAHGRCSITIAERKTPVTACRNTHAGAPVLRQTQQRQGLQARGGWLPVSLSWAGRSPGGGRSHPLLFQSLASGSHQCPKYLQNKKPDHSSMSPPVLSTSLPLPGAGWSSSSGLGSTKTLPSAGHSSLQPT